MVYAKLFNFYKKFQFTLLRLSLLIFKKRYIFNNFRNSLNFKRSNKLKAIFDFIKYNLKFNYKKDQFINVFIEEDLLLLPPYGLPINRKGQIIALSCQTNLFKIFYRTLKYLGIKRFLIIYIKFLIGFKFDRINDPLFFLIPRHGYTYKSPNYCHWLSEDLPRLRYLLQLDDSVKVLVNSDLKKFQKYFLELLIKNNDIIEFDLKPISLSKLYIAAVDQKFDHYKDVNNKINTQNKMNSDKESRLWLRNTILENLKLNDIKVIEIPKRVFLMRNKNERRQILNFIDFNNILLKYNFSFYFPGLESNEEDIKNFNKFEIIMGLNGAGLSNLLFMKKGDVIELVPPRKKNHYWFHQMCIEYKLNYHRINLDVSNTVIENENIEINIDKFEINLNSTLKKINN